jgi:hypothetical protein
VAGADFPHGDDTLFVGIDPLAEISRELTYKQMIVPSEGQEYEELVESGYQAFMAWDGAMKKKVGARIPNYPALCFLWFLKGLEILYHSLYWLFYLLWDWVLCGRKWTSNAASSSGKYSHCPSPIATKIANAAS